MKKILFTFFNVALCFLYSQAQYTIDTHLGIPANRNDSNVTFQIESALPVTVTDIKSVFLPGNHSVEVWYRMGGVQHTAGTPPVISTTNGWVQLVSGASVTGDNATAFSIPGISLFIPSGTPVGVFIRGGVRSGDMDFVTRKVYTVGMVSVKTGDGYGYSSANAPYAPDQLSQFLGQITYEIDMEGNCAPFSRFSIDSVKHDMFQLNWTRGDISSSFYLEYGPRDFTPGTGTKITGTYPGSQPPLVVSGLTPETNYDVYFGEICSGGSDSTFFNSPFTIKTGTEILCYPVSAVHFTLLSIDSVSVQFESSGSNFDYQIGPAGFDQGTTTILSTSEKGDTLIGLEKNTSYDFYVRNDCNSAGNGLSTWSGPFSFTTGDSCGLKGVYTINPSQSTGGRNFMSFNDAATALEVCGVQGKVVFNVAPGTYNEQVEFTDIPGDDYTDIIFDGGMASNVTVTSFSSSSPGIPTFYLNGADHITLRNMTILNTTAGNVGVVVLQDSANYNTIDACVIDMEIVNTENRVYGIYAKSNTGDVMFHSANYLTISECYISGGDAGIRLDGGRNHLEHNEGNKIIGNTIRNAHMYGIRTEGQKEIKVHGNTIDSIPNTSAHAISFEDISYCEISSNYINIAGRGLHLQSVNDDVFTTGRSGVFNNMILSHAQGIHLYNVQEVNFFHNTVWATFSVEVFRQVINISLRNNILVADPVNSPVSCSFQSLQTTVPGLFMDNNIYYNTNPDLFLVAPGVSFGGIINIGGVGYSKLDDWRMVYPSLDQSSLQGMPEFMGPDDLHLYHILGNNAGAPVGINVDLDGEVRSSGTPDIGADEYTPAACLHPYGSSIVLTSLDNSSFTLSWEGMAGSQSYDVFVAPEGVPFGDVGSITHSVTDTSITVNDPVGDTIYNFYIRSNCGADSSTWGGPFNFRTLCNAKSAPYSNNFDSEAQGNDPPVCWAVNHSSPPPGGAPPLIAAFGSPGDNKVLLFTAVGSDSTMLISPMLSDLTDRNKQVKVSVFLSNPGALLIVGTVKDQQSPSSFSAVDTIDMPVGPSVQHLVYFDASSAYNGTDEFIAFLATGSPTPMGGAGLDSVYYEEMPYCPEVDSSIVFHEFSSDSVSFLLSSPGDSFDFEYGNVGFTLGTGTRFTGHKQDTIPNLLPSFTYDLYIRTNCTATDDGFSEWVGPFSFTTRCIVADQLSGNYTIDHNLPTSGRNFNSFSEAANELNICGISSSVVFNIAPGTYNENLNLEEIAGTDAENTVTFRGDSAMNTVLTFSPSAPSDNTPTVMLNGADHIRFTAMTIENTRSSSGSWAVFLRKKADYNSIDSCVVRVPSSPSNNVAAIVSSADLTSIIGSPGGDNSNYLSVTNSRIEGGSTGIYVIGSNNNYNRGHVIVNNIFVNNQNEGIVARWQTEIRIEGNDIGSQGNTQKAIFLNSVQNLEVLENQLRGSSRTLHLQGSGGTGNVIANNMIYGGSYGVYLTDVNNIDFVHNSATGNIVFHMEDQTGMKVKKNIFRSGGSYAFESDVLSGSVVDYNLYHTSSSLGLASINSLVYIDLPAWKGADASINLHSIEEDPEFISSMDLHISQSSPARDAGDTVLDVLTDIDGDIRPWTGSSYTDIGADEILLCDSSYNHSVSLIDCKSAVISWGPSDHYSIIEYDTAGFSKGTGNIVFGKSPLTISNLQAGTDYEFFVSDTCYADTITAGGPMSFTTTPNPVGADFSFVYQQPTPVDLTVDFNAASSTGASVYEWNFGDGSTATGVQVSHSYTSNQTYDVSLVVSGYCGRDTILKTVEIEGIDIKENILSQSLAIYPNPAQAKLQLSFETGNSEDVVICLTDLSGKEVFKQRLSGINGGYSGEIDISRLAKGSYMLKIESAELSAVKQLIKN